MAGGPAALSSSPRLSNACRRRRVARGLCAVAGLLLATQVLAEPPRGAPADPPDQATFFVVSDTHFNDDGILPEFTRANRAVIEALNDLPGRDYPPELGGVVAIPRGVLVLGDLTDGGKAVQWRGRWFWRGGFDHHYPRAGSPDAPDRVRWPVFALPGNHDLDGGRTTVSEALRQRYGGSHLALEWGPIRLLLVGRYADAEARAWLRDTLASAPPARPVVLFQHYSFPGSAFGGDEERWWTARDKSELEALLRERRVAALFHGHAHAPESYHWAGLPVFNPGSAEHNRTFAVVRAGAERLDVAWYEIQGDAGPGRSGGAWLRSASVSISGGD